MNEASPEPSATAPGLPPPRTSLPFGATVTIFFSDIRGFTDYTSQHGDEAAWRVLRQYNALMSKQVEIFGGRVVKTQGDGFMVHFPTARAAILCAVAIQRAMEEEAQNEPGARIELGIGINTGEPIQEDGDFFGSTVNLAARICAMAAPGQILVSETSRYVARRLEGVEFVDRGLREMKGFPEPQHLYEIRWAPETRTRAAADSPDMREELGALGGLAERFRRLGADLVEASRAIQERGTPPVETLAGQLVTLRADFAKLRTRLFQRASEVGVTVAAAPDALVSIGALQPVLTAIAEAVASASAERDAGISAEERSHQAALEAAVQRAIGVLSRVLVIMHRDDAAFQPLLECQAKASELRLTLSRLVAQNPGYGVERVDEAMLPFADLVALVADREHLDDGRFAQLEGALRRAFGPPLAVAAARGRLYVEGQESRVPKAVSVAPAPAEVAARRPAAPAAASAPAPPRPPDTVRPAAAVPAPAAPSLDPRIAQVRWWAEASVAWTTWRTTGVAFAHAARSELTKHPHLLSVVLQSSADVPGGSVAASYFLLLEHLDRAVPGSVRRLADRVLASAGREPLGQRLYQTLVADTRLPETYLDFVRDVMVAVIPTPGVWTDGGVVETEEATTVVRRPGGLVGKGDEQEQRLTESRERYVERRFPVTVGPLTTRFFYLKSMELKEPRDVVVRLTEEGKASSQAWLLVQHMGYVAAPRRQNAQGTALPGLGHNYSGIWVAVFNTAWDSERSFEVILSVSPQSQQATRRWAFAPTSRDAR